MMTMMMMMMMMYKNVTQFVHRLVHLEREMEKTLTHLTAQFNQLGHGDDDDDDDDGNDDDDYDDDKNDKLCLW